MSKEQIDKLRSELASIKEEKHRLECEIRKELENFATTEENVLDYINEYLTVGGEYSHVSIHKTAEKIILYAYSKKYDEDMNRISRFCSRVFDIEDIFYDGECLAFVLKRRNEKIIENILKYECLNKLHLK